MHRTCFKVYGDYRVANALHGGLPFHPSRHQVTFTVQIECSIMDANFLAAGILEKGAFVMVLLMSTKSRSVGTRVVPLRTETIPLASQSWGKNVLTCCTIASALDLLYLILSGPYGNQQPGSTVEQAWLTGSQRLLHCIRFTIYGFGSPVVAELTRALRRVSDEGKLAFFVSL